MVQVKAVIFGAIGVIAETSDLQQQAFNLAFAEAGMIGIGTLRHIGDCF